jgi:uncharacterized iron-regulated protein
VAKPFGRVDVIKKIITAILLVIVFNTVGWVKQDNVNHRMFDLNQEKELLMTQALAKLKKNRIILVGEHHSNKQHHRAQLSVIQALNDAGLQVAVGLEMFRKDSQPALDRWTSGDLDEKRFEKIFYDNWRYPWPVYRMIFKYARDHKIPMIGLNVPRGITRQVSREGFKSLSQAQKGKLAEVSCIVDQEYMNYIRKAFGGHAHGQLNFIYFCEAQLVWDSAMAVYSLDYLKRHPDAVVVILAGTGHAQKGAVPRQIRARSNIPYAVILPEISGKIDRDTISKKDADYIILDLE